MAVAPSHKSEPPGNPGRFNLPEKTFAEYECFDGETPEDVLKKAREWLASHPTPEQQHLQSYLSLVAKAVEFGKAKGFDTAMINPLESVMKKLSENAITAGFHLSRQSSMTA